MDGPFGLKASKGVGSIWAHDLQVFALSPAENSGSNGVFSTLFFVGVAWLIHAKQQRRDTFHES